MARAGLSPADFGPVFIKRQVSYKATLQQQSERAPLKIGDSRAFLYLNRDPVDKQASGLNSASMCSGLSKVQHTTQVMKRSPRLNLTSPAPREKRRKETIEHKPMTSGCGHFLSKLRGDNRAQNDAVWLRPFSVETKTINGLPYKPTLEQAKEEQRAVPRY